jgi:hypothetical protein
VYVSLPDEVYGIIKEMYEGKLGESESEVIRNMVIAFLSQRGDFVTEDSIQTKDRLALLETYFEALIETLEDKGNFRVSDLDAKMKKKAMSK